MVTTSIQPRLEEGEFIKLLGGRPGCRISTSLDSRLRRWKSRLYEAVSPRIVHRVCSVKEASKKNVLLAGRHKVSSPKLVKAMQGCREAVCFLATIGFRVETEIRRLTRKNRISEAFIVDALGSAAVENMVENFYGEMRRQYAAQGRSIGLRFSPGYCDWTVEGQKALFKILPYEKVGVDLSDVCLMKPRKSISGVFGVYDKRVDPSRIFNPCDACPRKNCSARRSRR